jgi:hypothetical protein
MAYSRVRIEVWCDWNPAKRQSCLRRNLEFASCHDSIESTEALISVGLTGYQGVFCLQNRWENASEQFTITLDRESLLLQQR